MIAVCGTETKMKEHTSSTEPTTGGEGESNKVLDSKEFYDALRAKSRDYRRLCEEKQKHEESPALQAVANERRSYFEKMESLHSGNPVTPSLWPYKKHYEKCLPKKLQKALVGKTFCDIGSAPGGMSAFLCKSLYMTGAAFSLPEDQGGFTMNFECADRLTFAPCDLSEEEAWKDQLQSAVGNAKFAFINLGVTLQWLKPPLAETDDQSHDQQPEKAQRNNRLTMQQILRNELLFALQSVTEGGAIMVTLPNSDHPNTFLYLRYLVKCTTTENSVHVFPTPKLGRNPVYVLVEDIDPECGGTKECIAFLLSTKVSLENDSKWLVGSWEEAMPAFDVSKKSLEFLWRKQLQQLKKDRKDAERKHGPQRPDLMT